MKALLAFEAASRHGSISQGAEELGVTPSAVSHHVQQLEEFLGVQLFQRHAGRISPTDAGRAYAQEIASAFETIASATNALAPRSQRGCLVIATGPSFAAKWLRPRLAEFLTAYPDVKVRLSTLSSRNAVETERFDVAVAYGRPPGMEGRVEPLLVEHLRPLCTPLLAATLDLRSPADLSRATLIHSVNALTWANYFRVVGEPGLQSARELWLDRSTMAIEAAVGGLGIILESEILAAEEIADGRLHAPFGDGRFSVETTSYYLVKTESYATRRAITAFESWLRDAFRKANLTVC